METHKLSADEWDALLDEEKMPLKQERSRNRIGIRQPVGIPLPGRR